MTGGPNRGCMSFLLDVIFREMLRICEVHPALLRCKKSEAGKPTSLLLELVTGLSNWGCAKFVRTVTLYDAPPSNANAFARFIVRNSSYKKRHSHK